MLLNVSRARLQHIAKRQRAQRRCVVQLALSEPGKRVELQASLIGALLQRKEWKRAEEQLLQALGEADDQRAVPFLRQLVDVQVRINVTAWHSVFYVPMQDMLILKFMTPCRTS